jgi:hypothetical protein
MSNSEQKSGLMATGLTGFTLRDTVNALAQGKVRLQDGRGTVRRAVLIQALSWSKP